MKAIFLTGIGQMELRDIPKPIIENDTNVLLKIETVGVCGSDVHYYTSGGVGGQSAEFPFIVGHECAGVVEKAGSAVTEF